MIGRLRGEVLERGVNSLVVDVHGVGYLVQVTSQNTLPVGAAADLYIHTHVREDALTLFGFVDPRERTLFNLLIGVPTIGPVKAMGILETPVPVFAQLVLRREVGRLAKLPGVGKKTAERIVVDLADKLAGLAVVAEARPTAATAPPPRLEEDLVSALVNLGFKETRAEELAAASLRELEGEVDLEVALKAALALAR